MLISSRAHLIHLGLSPPAAMNGAPATVRQVRSAGTSIIVLIDNLDRCRADYVVEMLEGIQTLLRNPRAATRWSLRRPPRPERFPFIAFVVRAMFLRQRRAVPVPP
jgi:KAP family P-loop domain